MKIKSATGTYLDFVRALAANLVVVQHFYGVLYHRSPPISKLGSLAVVVFFLLSGFLIAYSVCGRLQRGDASVGEYVIDRFSRIYAAYLPALLLVIIVDAVLVSGSYGQQGLSRGVMAALGNMLMLQDYPAFQVLDVMGHGGEYRVRPYNTAEPFWTVSIEMWLYVAFGGALLPWPKAAGPRCLMSLVFVASLLVAVWHGGVGPGRCLTLVWAVGACFGCVFFYAKFLPSSHKILVALVCALGTLVVKVKKDGFDPYDFHTATIIAVLLFGLALLVQAYSSQNMKDAGSSRIAFYVTFFASYSYSLYLVHNTVCVVVAEHLPAVNFWVALGLVFSLSHLCAWLLYIVAERHHKALAEKLKKALLRSTARDYVR